jgi:hypothetical protein
MVLLYSDGPTDARRPDGELFAVEPLAEFIKRQAANGLPTPKRSAGRATRSSNGGEGSERTFPTV